MRLTSISGEPSMRGAVAAAGKHAGSSRARPATLRRSAKPSRAAEHGLFDTGVHELTVDALLNRWSDSDPRWDLLPQAA